MNKQRYVYSFLIISSIILGCAFEETVVSEEVNLSGQDDPAPLEQQLEMPAENITVENSDIVAEGNETIDAVTEQGSNETLKYVNCLLGMGTSEVQIVNDTELIKLLLPNPNITSRETPSSCLCVLFFSKHCPFSSQAAPHFNALPRAYPDLQMVAINAITYHLFNTQNGIVGVPSLLLLHNGKIIDKFNESDYTLEQFSRFLTKNTGIPAAEKSFVTSADFAGPVASVPNKETDILLIAAWCFIVFCAVYYFSRSSWWRWIVESVKHTWRESEAQTQHEHTD